MTKANNNLINESILQSIKYILILSKIKSNFSNANKLYINLNVFKLILRSVINLINYILLTDLNAFDVFKLIL